MEINIVGAGLIVIGAAMGIGRIGGSLWKSVVSLKLVNRSCNDYYGCFLEGISFAALFAA